LRTTARITAFNPGQSPPPVSMPTFIACTSIRVEIVNRIPAAEPNPLLPLHMLLL